MEMGKCQHGKLIYMCTCIMEISRMDKILGIVNSRDKRESMAY